MCVVYLQAAHCGEVDVGFAGGFNTPELFNKGSFYSFKNSDGHLN